MAWTTTAKQDLAERESWFRVDTAKFFGEIALILAFLPLTLRFIVPLLGAQKHESWRWGTEVLVISTLTLWTIAMCCVAYAKRCYAEHEARVRLATWITAATGIIGGCILTIVSTPIYSALSIVGGIAVLLAIIASPEPTGAEKERRRLDRLARREEVWRYIIRLIKDDSTVSFETLRHRAGYTPAELKAVLDYMVGAGLLRYHGDLGYSLKGGMPLRELGY